MAHYTHVQTPLPNIRKSRKLHLCEVAKLVMQTEIKTIEFWRAVISECLGTFFYVLIGCSSSLVCTGTFDIKQHTLHASLCFGLAVAMLVQCFGHISGAHFNPAITLAMAATCKITPLRGALYFLAQIGGGIAGAALLYSVAPENCNNDLGATALQQGIGSGQGFGVEFLLTFILVFTVFATVDPDRKELGSKGLAIGLAVCACHLAGYRYTKCSVNPARSLGPSFVMNQWKDHWIYWVGPLTGGLLAGLLYEYIFDPKRMRRGLLMPNASPVPPPEPENEEEEGYQVPDPSIVPNNQRDSSYGFAAAGRARSFKSYMSVSRIGQENEAYHNDASFRRYQPSPFQYGPPLPPPNPPPPRREDMILDDVGIESPYHLDPYQKYPPR